MPLKRFSIIILAIGFGFCVPAGRGTAIASVVVDRVVAVVNDEVITLSDLQREEALKKGKGQEDERLTLEDMIDRKLLMAAAKRSGMDVTDKELSDAIADIMKRNTMDDKQFEAALGGQGLTLSQYKTELREQMTISRMVNKYVRAGLSVDENEVRAFYERNRAAYALPEEIRLRQIFIPLPDHATQAQAAAAKAEAGAAYQRVKKGEDFIGLVREYSTGGSAEQDGDLGFTQRDQLIPEMQDAVRSLKPGEVSAPVLCTGGYHIIRLEEVRTPVKPYEKVKNDIMTELYQQKLENSYRSWLQTLRTDATIQNLL